MYINPMVPHNIIFGGLGHTTTAGRKLIFYVDLERENERELWGRNHRGTRQRGYIDKREGYISNPYICTKQQSNIILATLLLGSSSRSLLDAPEFRYASCREASSYIASEIWGVAFLFHLQVLLGCKVGQHSSSLLLDRSHHLFLFGQLVLSFLDLLACLFVLQLRI